MADQPVPRLELVGPEPEIDTAVVIVAVRPPAAADGPVQANPADVDRVARWGVDLPRRLARARATGARGEVTWIDLERDDPPVAVLVLGLGGAGPADLRRAAAVATRRLRGLPDATALATRDLDEAGMRAFTEGLLLGAPPPTWASTAPTPSVDRVRLAAGDPDAGGRALAAGVLHGSATLRARGLVHAPPNTKDPAWLAGQVVRAAEEAGLVATEVVGAQLAEQGFGGIVAVGSGSARPPRLVRIEWVAPGGGSRHVVLVGKGITFDSGGLSLKPRDSQPLMKTDMSGAAAVAAVMAALPDVAPEGLRVTALLCIAENLPGASALRPGDVITHHGGLTSEVRNTDAEGRLVLADALDHAVRDLHADVVVDVATLTGAATLGLGRRHGALFSTSGGLADALEQAGSDAGELLWRMPLHADYAELISSEVADQANAEQRPGPGPGSITAGLFLQRFVGETPWAHLDIAGPARSDSERDDVPKGGTGFGARVLLRWLEAGAPA